MENQFPPAPKETAGPAGSRRKSPERKGGRFSKDADLRITPSWFRGGFVRLKSLMSLHIEESTSEEVSVLTLRGQLTFGDADGIRDKILALAAAGHSRIVID